ncbi:MAG: ferrous iron transport protein B [Deltaproteobacteria bacterium CG11_big_fil_rev_8_21_14_0_20_47_16]|nr:MAG: ferrous iron transport protein B [Deltaproteobacteria bacterium CG11_big_fil_rev_8_21_14_0_20_47_16]
MKPAIAFLGNPNTGKTTLFNALTGLRQQVGNYPGVTVERKHGQLTTPHGVVELIDLPGTYSLAAQSPDEEVVANVLRGHQKGEQPLSGVVVIVDASNLKRNLYLVSQVLEVGLPTIVVLNMMDIAKRRGVTIDVTALEKRLGVPVIPMKANVGGGVTQLNAALMQVVAGQIKIPKPVGLRDPETGKWQSGRTDACGDHPIAQEAVARYNWIRGVLHGIVFQVPSTRSHFSDRLDKVLTHRVWGTVIFVIVMLFMFQAIYSWAGPLQDMIDNGVSALGEWVGSWMPSGVLKDLVQDGVIGGVGSVLVFLPQIVFLFLFIAFLEDCGYMARAAFLMDRLFARIGLSGKSFIPMLSSFACAIPGVMATRTIENRRDRFVTILVSPLMSCSARLPVYTLLIAAFVPSVTWMGGLLGFQGAMLFAMHALGFAVAIPIVWILKRTVLKGATPPFVMELPSYKMPSLKLVGWRALDRAKTFVQSAGTIILAMSVVIWALSYFPTADHNYFAMMGHAIEPLVKPLGWDWRIGMSVLAAFPAREVVIAAMATSFNVNVADGDDSSGILQALQNATWPDGAPLFGLAVAMSVMIFFALCCQCGATVAIIRRETNSWKWAGFAFAYMTILAYLAAAIVYQVMAYFGVGI